jgi:hypothetical protein
MKRIGFGDFERGRLVRVLALSRSIERSPFN